MLAYFETFEWVVLEWTREVTPRNACDVPGDRGRGVVYSVAALRS